MSDDFRQHGAAPGKFAYQVLAAGCLGAMVLFGTTGCGSSGTEKDLSPEEVEEIRQEHETMSQREMSNE